MTRFPGTDETVIYVLFFILLNKTVVLLNYAACPLPQLPEHGSFAA
jgi:hypothetical protein